jgi:hypothetical protein
VIDGVIFDELHGVSIDSLQKSSILSKMKFTLHDSARKRISIHKHKLN